MSTDPEILATLDGVTGLCHHRGGIILSQRLPDSLTKDKAAALCAGVSRAFAAYHSAERPLTEFWLEFPAHGVLAFARPAASGEPPREFLTFLLSGRDAVPAVTAAAAAWQSGTAPA